MREMDLLVDREVFSIADSGRCGGPLPDAIKGEHGGLLKWRRIEGRGGVAQVVLAESQAIIPVKVRLNRLEFAGEQRFLKQFLAQPQRQRHAKRGEAGWTQGKVRFQEPFELDEGFVVKDNK